MGRLLQFICPKCGKELVWTLETAKVQCNHCFKWIRAKDLKTEPKTISDDDKTEQLRLF